MAALGITAPTTPSGTAIASEMLTAGIEPDRAAGPARVHLGMIEQRAGDQSDQEIGMRELVATELLANATKALASTSRARKKCGTVVQLCVVRSAIRRAIALRDSAQEPRALQPPLLRRPRR